MKDLFTLRIEIGNDAMQPAEDVAAALRHAADRLEGAGIPHRMDIRDAYGSIVGDYGTIEPPNWLPGKLRGGDLVDAMEADKRAARDGYNPNR